MAAEEVNKPPSLPPYPEMILEAIADLNEKDGSNKSSISKYIESKHGDLPAGHSNLLSDHLNSMKDSGELVFLKNNYMKPDPNAPPKRGRGRPRKDPNAPPAQKKARPAATSSGPTVSKTGRPRGRPRKVKPEMAQTGVQAN
ncbi:hypothetical protein F0562_004139 [Nyssa sinensis]|uniref:HMG-Y-related protein A n=1 Tax=Nyssa sinensis TaxID=561372 RepID=A0A5J5C0L6_9ASTE|nr:hypothetical protein F0562_004139 [Nyssa sinensis]